MRRSPVAAWNVLTPNDSTMIAMSPHVHGLSGAASAAAGPAMRTYHAAAVQNVIAAAIIGPNGSG